MRLVAGNKLGQNFTLGDAAVTTSDGYSLSIGAPSAVPGLEVDGGSGNDIFNMARTAIGLPTTLVGGAGGDQYLAANEPLSISSNIVFQAGGTGDSAVLGDPSPAGDTSHNYSIGGGTIQRDGVAGFRYSGLSQLNMHTGDAGSFVNIRDAAGMLLLTVTGGRGPNILQMAANANGLGMALGASVFLNGASGGPNLFIVVPDPAATFHVAGGAGNKDRMEVDFAAGTGAVLTTGLQSGSQYTFTSRKPIYFSGIGSLNDLPAPAGPAAAFKSSAPQTVVYKFASDVGGSISAGSLILKNTDTNAVVPTSDISLVYDASTYTATFSFPGFAGGVLPGANYLARIPAGAISDTSGTPLAADDDLVFTAPMHQVTGRFIFYGGSYFDGGAPAPNSNDSNAIAPNKRPLRPGQTASFLNYTSYDRGINGIMVDFQGLLNAAGISASDFAFRVGNSNDPTTWATAPAPSQVIVRAGGGLTLGTDRVEIIWPDRAITNTWLQVTVSADANTGLATPDVFYFGNAIGESGNSSTDTFVDGFDFAGARDNQRDFLNRAGIAFPYDYNRDSFVDGIDMAIARDYANNFLTALKLITAPAASTGTALANAAITPTATSHISASANSQVESSHFVKGGALMPGRDPASAGLESPTRRSQVSQLIDLAGTKITASASGSFSIHKSSVGKVPIALRVVVSPKRRVKDPARSSAIMYVLSGSEIALGLRSLSPSVLPTTS